MRITWSIPVWGQTLTSTRGDMVRARHLIAALRRQGHDVKVVERSGGESDAGTELMVKGYRGVVRRLLPEPAALALRDVSRYANSRAFGKRVAAEARAHRSDIIVETQINGAVSGAVAARMTGLPLVLDDCSPSCEEQEIGSGLPSVAHRVLMSQAKAATTVVATSRSVRDRLVREGLPAEKVRIVRNGVDLEAFDRADRTAIRERLGLADRCVVGFVGSFLDWHRVDLLIEAVSGVERRHALNVLLVGAGANLEPVLRQAAELGIADRVVSVGAVQPERVPAYIAAFDVGVLPDTLDYGNPMKLTEYAAASLPTVAPDRPSVREVVRRGKTGLLFAPGRSGAMAAALSRLAGDAELRQQLGSAGRQFVATNATWGALAGQLLDGVAGSAAARTRIGAAVSRRADGRILAGRRRIGGGRL